ncbi:Uncharacterized conserved protein [Kingella potus]|uniref:UPF0250 protein NCTC13336_00163 n=1 Tax=Kingella potus TaxID=265175 RepID=A0A377QYV6_9NEIS|nr:DUF493 domain-containing protein [Kingella potus]UOP01715.1 DUF493 domain-containing protein [Kingella potus]STQ99975.1 Uncharacterized conserved protein [Kingella potus]
MTQQRDTLIEFPCAFPIKVMGGQHPDFLPAILETVRRHAPETEQEHITSRPSSGGNYLAATVTVQAQNQEHLDGIYRSLTAHPLVKVVL